MTTWAERSANASIAYDIQPQYERALGGFHPAYFSDVTVLGQDGWNPYWALMWAHKAPNDATWATRAHVAASWTERT